jgi:hypothetical protein
MMNKEEDEEWKEDDDVNELGFDTSTQIFDYEEFEEDNYEFDDR